jgi:MFS transporter, OFA family, oxalate/formate antiporter
MRKAPSQVLAVIPNCGAVLTMRAGACHFPSTLTDTFGAGNAPRNYGCLYIAQGIGSIFGGPMAALLHDNTGSWVTVFAVAIAADITAALLAIVVLKPMRRAYHTRP